MGDMRVDKMIVPAVAERFGPCLAEAKQKDDHCADDLHRCVRESVLAAARPAPEDEQICQSLDSACRRAKHPPNYTKEQCAKVLAASQPGPARAQVEKALGPSSEEPAPCDISYIWPPMPFTPYFP